ncbi:uncharacterized protein LOC114277046 [Camellia sinensis]|uniref:uncharacterized protein LOC114277046 n=1 Tax=Camellia sinensis TaxID=4442 RepID=UPI001035F0BC|nr:uncharacterized protein LOC114277046 [Camellia sinensis]
MATVTDAAAAANVGEDQNPGATSLPTSVVNPVVTPTVPGGPLNYHEHLEKFTEVNFKRWQQKMLFYLTTVSLASFLSEDPPVVEENEQDKQKLMALDTWKQLDFLCLNYVLNGLADSLFNVFYAKKSVKELWNALDKYETEDVGAKKFVVGRFLDFKMVDLKTVMRFMQSECS